MGVSSLCMSIRHAAGTGRVKDRRLRRPLVCLDSAGSSGYLPHCTRRGRPFHPTTNLAMTLQPGPGAGPGPGPGCPQPDPDDGHAGACDDAS